MSLIPYPNQLAEHLRNYPDEPGALTRARAIKAIHQALTFAPVAPPDPASGAAELHVEAWQCDQCGEKVPCRVEVVSTKTPFHDDASDPRFSARRCICETGHVPYWIQTRRTA
jgi:hypothetical protein